MDSCIAAALAASVTEGPLTGPAGGGFLLAYVDREPLVLDCFFAVPSRPLGEMEEIVVDFGDASTQVFHVGEASVAVPGLLAGLENAHRRFGRLPWADLAAPALELAGAGVDVSETQAVPPPDPGRDPAARRGRPADLRQPRPSRHRRLRRHARGDSRPRRGRRRRASAGARGRPRRLRGRRARARPDDLPGPRGARDPGPVARRQRRHACPRAAGNRGHARRPGPRDPVRLRERAGRADGGDDPHLGRRRARRRRRALVHARLRLGRLPRRHAAEQHARRARRDRRGATHARRASREHDDAGSSCSRTVARASRSAAPARSASPARSRR